MILRIETTNITSGREFSLYAHSVDTPSVDIYAFNPVTKEVESLAYEYVLDGALHRFNAVAPSMNGFMLAKLNDQRIVKRIGSPLTTFVVGYKPNYTIPYKAIAKDGSTLYEGNLTHIIDGFYYAPINVSVVMMEVFNKRILINENLIKMEYEVELEQGEISSEFNDIELSNFDLLDIGLADVNLTDVVMDMTLPTVTLRKV